MVVRELIALLGFKTDETSLKKAESSIDGLKRAAIKLSAIFLTGAVAVGFGKLIDLASEAEERQNKFTAVFGKSSEKIQKSLDDTSRRTGIASGQLQQFAANIGAVVRPALGSAEAAGEMAAKVAELALDIASFNDLEPEVALAKLRSGLLGSVIPLDIVGVNLRKANLENSAYFKGLGKTVEALTQGELIQVRFNATIEQLIAQNALGDAERTAEGFANASRALSTQIKQLGETLGKFLLKDAGMTILRFSQIIATIQGWIAANKELIQQRVDDVLQVINNTIEGIVNVLRFAVRGWQLFGEAIGPVASGLLTVTGILLALIAILGAPVVLFLAISAAIGLVIDDLVVFARGGRSVFGALITTVKNFVKDSGIDFETLFGTFSKIWELMKAVSVPVFDFIAQAGKDAWDSLSAFAKEAWESIGGTFGEGETDVVGIINSMIKAFDEGFDSFEVFTKEAFEFIKKFFDDSAAEGDGLFDRLGAGLLDFVKSIASGPLGKAILTAVGGGLAAFVTAKLTKRLGPLAAPLILAAGAGGAFLGGKLAESLGGGGDLPASPAVAGGGGGATITTGATEINIEVNGGSGTPEQVGEAVVARINQEQENLNRRTMQQLTTAGSTP